MSPAMVDFRSPVSSSSEVQSNHHRSQSFVAGRIPSFSSHNMFSSSDIPDASQFIDRLNLGQGVSASREKPSVQRLRKHRKRSGISQARPATLPSHSGSGLRINPSRSEMSQAAPLVREKESGMQFMREQFSGWTPFVTDPSTHSSSGTEFVFRAGLSRSNASSSNLGARSVEGTAVDAYDRGSGNIDKGVFTFGSGIEKVCNRNRSSSHSSSAQSLGSADFVKSGSAEAGMPADNAFSDNCAFIFGNSDKKDGGLLHSSLLGSDNCSFSKLNLSKNIGEKSGKLDSGYFVHKDGEKKSAHSSKNSSFTSNDGQHSEQPDFHRKTECENSSTVDSNVFVFGHFVETKVGLDQNSTTFFKDCSFSTVSTLPEELRKLKLEASKNGEKENKVSGAFVFGSSVNKSTCASKSSSFESFDSSFSKLPEKMDKLNLQTSVGEVHRGDELLVNPNGLKKNALFSETSSSGHDEKGFSNAPGELRNQNLGSSGNLEHGHANQGVFVFNSDVKKNYNSVKSSSLNFDLSSISKLPDEIRNMKLNSSDNDANSPTSKPVNTWNQDIFSNFTLDSGKDEYGSKVAPLQEHNSCKHSVETTTSCPPPSFQAPGCDFCFTGMNAESETPIMEFRSQKQDTSNLTKENLFTELHQNLTRGFNKGNSKGVRLKKNRGKSTPSTPIHTSVTQRFVFDEKSPRENQEQDSAGGYSPMDYSPYQETLVSDRCPREAFISSDDFTHFDSLCTSTDAPKLVFDNKNEGELPLTTDHFDIYKSRSEYEVVDCGFRVPNRNFISADGLHEGNFEVKNENAESGVPGKSSFMESESFGYGGLKPLAYEASNGFMFTSSRSQDADQSNFLFATTSSINDSSFTSKRNYRRKSRVKGGQELHPNSKMPLASPSSNLFIFPSSHVPNQPKQEENCGDDVERVGKVYGAKPYQDSAEEACEKWRLRGNQAYADGNLAEAEDLYSRGVASLYLDVSKRCSRALVLCYSNRAATRMSLGRLREALSDCKMAVAIDPSFLRARVRAGNIHLSLGESAEALMFFEQVLQLDNNAKSDQKILLEAVDGLEKTQKLNDLMDQSSILLTKRTLDDTTKALEIITKALSIGPNSEILLEMKAEALVKLRNFDEAIQLCEKTLEFAEKNACAAEPDSQLKDVDRSKLIESSKSIENSHSRLWRWRIISNSYFHLGRLEEANELLQKHEKEKPVVDKYWNRCPESSTSFPATVQELLRLKAAGNEAFQAGRHLEAVDFYTTALTLNTESRPYTAICFCNRAAAFQALGQIADAIADCSLAIALDSAYRKAISRRATLHEMIRDYGQAAFDLRKLSALLEMMPENTNISSISITDLNSVRARLCTVEEEARKGSTLDYYMILGVERSCSSTDVRKAYRKAALRHHPDKAGQILARSENGDDNVWREISDEVHSDADRLFKMIGEAHAILADPTKRLQYDTEEELRTMKKGYGHYGSTNSFKSAATNYSNQYERSSDVRQRHSYGSTYRHWPER